MRSVLAALFVPALVAGAAQEVRPDMTSPAVIRGFLEAYGNGDQAAVDRWLASAPGGTDLSSLGRAIRAASGPDLRTALFLLEIASREPIRASSFLDEGRAIVRGRHSPFGADPAKDRFEILWHQAAIAVAQSHPHLTVQLEALDAAERRLAEAEARGVRLETRIPLARAMAAGVLCCWKPVVGALIRSVPGALRRGASLEKALALFERAAKIEGLEAEALVRGAALLESSGRYTDAVRWLEGVPNHDDTLIAYFHYMTRARALERLDRVADAVHGYENALQIAPDSQVAAIGLSSAYLRVGRPDEAWRVAAKARTLQRKSSVRLSQFERGDLRFVADWLAELRRLVW